MILSRRRMSVGIGIITGVVTVAPIVCLLFVTRQLWNRILGWNDLFDFWCRMC